MGCLTTALRLLRHPLRWALTALALHALIGDFAGGMERFAAQAAVLVGLLCGELLGRSRLRSGVALATLVALGGGALLAGAALVGLPGCTGAVGARAALHLQALLSFGALSFVGVSGLRVLSHRYDVGRVLEALTLSACFALAFAAHRQGAVGRPLWLGDLAWSLGADPSALLLTLAAVLGVGIAALMALEARSRLSLGALVLLPVLALVMMLVGSRVAWQRDSEPLGTSRLQGEMEQGSEGQSPNEEEGEQGEAQSQDGQADAGGAEPEEGQQPQDGDGQSEGQQSQGEEQGGGQGGQQPQDGGGQGGEQPQDGGGQGGEQPQDAGGQGGEQPQDAGGQPQDGEQDGQGQQPQDGEGGGGQPQEGGGQSGGEPQEGDDPSGGEGGGQGGQPQNGGDPSDGNPQDGDQESEDPSGSEQGSEGGGQSESEQQSEDAEGEGDGEGQGAKQSAPVAVVLLQDDHIPPSEIWYLRQDAWSDYSGQRMVPSAQEGLDLDVLTSFPAGRVELGWAPQGDARVAVRAEVALLVEHTAPFALDSPVSIEPIDNPNRSRFVRAYAFDAMAWEGEVEALLGREAGDPTWTGAIWEAYTEAPEDPRYAALAEEMVAGLSEEAQADPFAQALSMKLWLDAHMTYSTAEKHEGVADPTADFLFGNLIGYCTHSAHALTYLMRTRGLPARVAGGYAVEETERRGSTLLVRDHQAHAWAELYLAGQGWVPIDVSPAETLDPPAEPLDEELVEQLSQMARGEDPDQSEEDEEEPQDSPRLSLPDLTWLIEGLRSLLSGLLRSLIVLFLPLHWAVKLWRRLTPHLGGQRSAPRLAYRAALDRLAEQGLRRAEGETRERFAQRVMPISSSFRKLTELHVRAALGPPDQAPTPKRALLVTQAAVQQELRAHTPTWRWLLGLLNPFSIYGVR